VQPQPVLPRNILTYYFLRAYLHCTYLPIEILYTVTDAENQDQKLTDQENSTAGKYRKKQYDGLYYMLSACEKFRHILWTYLQYRSRENEAHQMSQ